MQVNNNDDDDSNNNNNDNVESGLHSLFIVIYLEK